MSRWRIVGIARRTLFRYYPSKNAIPWGDFDAHLNHFAAVLDRTDPSVSLLTPCAPRRCWTSTRVMISKTDRHRARMRLIPGDRESTYSMTMYASWRG